jgi:hypothetical protein
MRDASDVPQLHEYQTTGLVHAFGHEPPSFDLLLAMNSRCPGIALTLHGYLGRLADDQCGRGPLRVITGVEGSRDIPWLARARAGQGRHDNPVRESERASRKG